jgi:hypothetical protein
LNVRARTQSSSRIRASQALRASRQQDADPGGEMVGDQGRTRCGHSRETLVVARTDASQRRGLRARHRTRRQLPRARRRRYIYRGAENAPSFNAVRPPQQPVPLAQTPVERRNSPLTAVDLEAIGFSLVIFPRRHRPALARAGIAKFTSRLPPVTRRTVRALTACDLATLNDVIRDTRHWSRSASNMKRRGRQASKKGPAA